MAMDSTSKQVRVESKVRFRGQEYHIKNILPGEGRWNSCAFEFQEDVHVSEIPDECSIDLIEY